MTGYGWLAKFVTVAILAGFSSVILVMLLGQTRVFYAMSKDGLVPKVFSDVHPRYQTPYKSQALFFVFTSLFAAFIPESVVGEMTSIGTLFAFMLVCLAVWIMRVRRPDLERGFLVPALPVGDSRPRRLWHDLRLGKDTWLRSSWLVIGMFIYFALRSHSRLNKV
jgi:APA family basic amino acid/polyamine antiporter